MNGDSLGRCLQSFFVGAALHLAYAAPALAEPVVLVAEPAPLEREPYFPSQHAAQREFGGPGPYVPQVAVTQRINGVVGLECEVKAKARLRKCAVVSESPARRDFGFAALRMAETGWMTLDPASPDSADLVGKRVRVQVVFNVPGGRTVP